MSAYINTSFEEISSQFGSGFCMYLLEALHCESFELLLKDEPQVVVYEVFCLVKVYHCLYKLYQFFLRSLVCIDSVLVFVSFCSLFFSCWFYSVVGLWCNSRMKCESQVMYRGQVRYKSRDGSWGGRVSGCTYLYPQGLQTVLSKGTVLSAIYRIGLIQGLELWGYVTFSFN